MQWKFGTARGLLLAVIVGGCLCGGGCRDGGEERPPVGPEPGAVGSAEMPAPEPEAPAVPTPAPDDAAAPASAAPTTPPAPAPEDVAAPAAPEDVVDVVPSGPRPLEPYEIEAQLGVLKQPRDVLDVFLTTKQPRLRHALLAEAVRHRITSDGLQTFLSSTPGLLDLPLPLAPLSYTVRPVTAEGEGVHRFEVRLNDAATAALREKAGSEARTVGYYTLVDEDGAPRVAWSGRDLATARLLLAKGAHDEADELARAIEKRTPYCGACEEIRFWAESRSEGGRKAWRGAGEHARRAVEWEPEVAAHHNALGVYYRNMRQYKQAREHLEKALALDPTSPAAGNLALLLEHQSRDDAALKAIDEYVAREPDELWPRLTRCRILKGLDRTEDAVTACRAALEREREGDETAHVAETHYLLAQLLQAQGDRKQALAHAEKALEYRPKYWLYVKLRDELAGK